MCHVLSSPVQLFSAQLPYAAACLYFSGPGQLVCYCFPDSMLAVPFNSGCFSYAPSPGFDSVVWSLTSLTSQIQRTPQYLLFSKSPELPLFLGSQEHLHELFEKVLATSGSEKGMCMLILRKSIVFKFDLCSKSL